jgi:short-subunit dehydrogenase
MARLDFRGRWVLVTGASSGLGESLSRRLAKDHGARLVLAARRAERLEALAASLRAEHGAHAVALPVDLAEPGAAERLFDRACEGRELYAIVANAATYWFGEFSDMPEESVDRLLRVNVEAPIKLVHRALGYLDGRGHGGVLVVASVGALMPSPGQALYSAGKAMLHALVQNTHYEREGGPRSGVLVSCCLPGGMMTEMLAGSPALEALQRWPTLMRTLMPPDEVARGALSAFAAGEPLFVPGALNRAMLRITSWLPRDAAGRGARRVYFGR